MQAISWNDAYRDLEEDQDIVYNGSNGRMVYTNHHSLAKRVEKSIRSDLEKMGFSYNIIDLADQIYSEIEAGTKRGKRRKQLIFFCVQQAYDRARIPEDPNKIAHMCGLDSSDISKAHSLCSTSKINFNVPLVKHIPEEFIPVYLQKLDWVKLPEDAVEDIIMIAQEVIESDPDLQEEKPQTVAAAVLVFYLEMHCIQLEKNKYKEIFGRSDMTINKIRNKVRKAYS